MYSVPVLQYYFTGRSQLFLVSSLCNTSVTTSEWLVFKLTIWVRKKYLGENRRWVFYRLCTVNSKRKKNWTISTTRNIGKAGWNKKQLSLFKSTAKARDVNDSKIKLVNEATNMIGRQGFNTLWKQFCDAQKKTSCPHFTDKVILDVYSEVVIQINNILICTSFLSLRRAYRKMVCIWYFLWSSTFEAQIWWWTQMTIWIYY